MVEGPQPRLTLQKASPQFHYYSLYVLMLGVDSHVNLNADEHASDLYILSVTIIGSILLYPAGGLNYIDALFFASGTATQSGLNTYVSGSTY